MTTDGEYHDAQLGDITLHYCDAPGGDGQPIVLLHGWPETSYAWRRLTPLLTPNRRVLAPDLRGYGGSTKPETPHGIEAAAEDIVALLERLGIEQAAVCGSDWGGFVAYALALKHPSLVSRMVQINMLCPINPHNAAQLFAPDQVPETWYWYMFQIEGFAEEVFAGRERTLVEYFLRHWCGIKDALTDADIAEYARAYAQPGALRGGFNYYRAVFAQDQMFFGQWMGQQVKPKTLILWGECDAIFPAAWLTGMEDCFADVEIARHAEAGHFVHEEAPEWAAERINSFLADV